MKTENCKNNAVMYEWKAREKCMKQHRDINVNVNAAIRTGYKICLIKLGTEEDKGKILKNNPKLRTLE